METVFEMKRMILLAAALSIALAAAAQPSGGRPQFDRERPTVAEEAQKLTDEMAAEFPLTDKQIKKVLKFFKKDIEYRRENFEFGGPRMHPEGFTDRPNGGFPGGGPGGPGGMGPGGPGGMGPGGHRPPGGHPGGMRPDGANGRPSFGEINLIEWEEYNEKQDNKLRKIIGDENFEIWIAKHPHKAPKLPEIKFDEQQ
jgi:hypothetical protein